MHVVSPGASPAQLTALLMPAQVETPCQIVSVRNRSAAISEAIGGGLIDDVLVGGTAGGMYVIYACDDEQTTRPANPRATVLAVRLGHYGREVQRRLRGTVLVVGLLADGTGDTDVPATVLTAATRAGITVRWP